MMTYKVASFPFNSFGVNRELNSTLKLLWETGNWDWNFTIFIFHSYAKLMTRNGSKIPRKCERVCCWWLFSFCAISYMLYMLCVILSIKRHYHFLTLQRMIHSTDFIQMWNNFEVNVDTINERGNDRTENSNGNSSDKSAKSTINYRKENMTLPTHMHLKICIWMR